MSACSTELKIRPRTRTHGALRLETRGKLLLIAWHRYARARAATPADQARAARWIAGLEALIYDQGTDASQTRAARRTAGDTDAKTIDRLTHSRREAGPV
jgi:hypothetical protein